MQKRADILKNAIFVELEDLDLLVRDRGEGGIPCSSSSEYETGILSQKSYRHLTDNDP